MFANAVHHDKLADQLIPILVRHDPQALAAEFAVFVRTVERDLKKHSAFLQLNRSGNRYFLKASCVNKRNLCGIENFAGRAVKQTAFGVCHIKVCTFVPYRAVNAILAQENHVLQSENKTELVLRVAPERTGYFRCCKFIASQVIKKNLWADVSLSCKASHPTRSSPKFASLA